MSVYDLATTLPDPEELLRRVQPWAMLDAIFGESFMVHTLDLAWSPDSWCAVMDDGGGNGWSITANGSGAWVRGFDHESPMSPWDSDRPHGQWLESVPQKLHEMATEPAFVMNDLIQTTFALWWLNADPGWHPVMLREASQDELRFDGSDWLFDDLMGGVRELVNYTDEFEKTLSEDDALHLLARRPLTQDLVTRINPDMSLDSLSKTFISTGYPR